MAQLAVGLAGAGVGSLFGAPGIGWAIGSFIGGQLFGPKPPDQEGPRLSDLTVQSATEGADMPLLWGDVRLPGMVIWADKKREIANEEDIDGKGGGSATYTTYTYTLNFAVSFGMAGDGSASKLRRVWANKKLIYDARADADAVSSGYNFKFYDGTQTAADPIIESVVGAGNAPAYKKQIVLVGYAWNLSKEFGNRLPQIDAEIVTNGTDAKTLASIETATQSGSLGSLYYSPATDTAWCTFDGNGAYNARLVQIEPHTKQVISNIELDDNGAAQVMPYTTAHDTGKRDQALVYQLRTAQDDQVYIYDLASGTRTGTITLGSTDNGYHLLDETASTVYVGAIRTAVGRKIWAFDKVNGSFSEITQPAGYEYIQRGGGIRLNDSTLLIAMERTSDSKIIWAQYDGAWTTTEVSDLATTVDVFSDPVRADDGFIYWPCSQGADASLVQINGSTGAEVSIINLDDLGAAGDFTTGTGSPFIQYVAEKRAIYFHTASTAHAYDIDTGVLTTWSGTTGSGWVYFHPPTNVLWSGNATGATTAYVYANRLDIVGTQGYDVEDILDDLCEAVGVTSGMRDWTGVSETVGGFIHTKMTSAAADMQPLLTYSLADAVGTGWKITGVELGGSSVDTITTGTTVAGNRVKRTKPHDVRLPNLSQTQYASSDADLQPGMAAHEWYTAPGNQSVQQSLPITLSDAEAVAFNQKFLQISYNLETFDFNLPPMYMALEPGDPITLLDGTRVKLTQVNRGYNGVLECQAVLDNPADLTASVVTPGAGVDDAVILSSSTPRLNVVDTPLLRDSDLDQPGPYLAAFTHGDDDPGISFFASADNQAFNGVGAIGTEPSYGTCDTVPTSLDEDTGWQDWDTTNTIRVRLDESGTLSSATNAEVLAGANAAVWGAPGRWEVVQWKTASLVSTDVHDLSDLLRGRRGTDKVINDHAADDWFIVISPSTLVRHSLQNADIGNQRYYKAIKSGQAVADVTSSSWTVGSNPLKPYSPINPTAANDGSDVDLDWTERTRKGGAYGGDNTLTDGVGAPELAGDPGSYTVIVCDSTGAVLDDSYTTTTNSRTMTAAELSGDYGGTPPTLFWRVRANSNVSGVEGFETPLQTHYITSPAETVIDGLSPDRFWKMDDQSGTTCVDAEGNFDLTYNNTPSLNQTTLTTIGTSVLFDSASNENASGGAGASPITNGASTFSVVFFMKHTDSTFDAILDIGSGTSDGIRFQVNASGNIQVKMWHAATNTTFGSTGGPISQGTGYAIALRFGDESGSNWGRLYVDGTEVASNNFGSDTLAMTGSPVAIAGAALSAQFKGNIDCVALWGSTRITTTNVSDIADANAENF